MPNRRTHRGAVPKSLAWSRILACLVAAAVANASAATLAEKAKESGCVNKPMWLAGDTYRCATQSGAFSYFNVPGVNGGGSTPGGSTPGGSTPKAPTPAGFPRVDPETQKGRDGVRRKVLADELAAEEKLLSETRVAYADGAPAPLPEERADAEKYRARIARLRQSLVVHERNIEALKKELAAVR
jgi:hypothetical protein